MFTIVSVIGRFVESIGETNRRRRRRRRRRLRREQIIQLCRSVLTGKDEVLCKIINEYDFSSIIKIDVTEETFEDTFRRVCEEVFKIRAVRKAYITAMFAYATKLNEYHLVHSKTWYQTDLLIYSLVDILEAKTFDPCMLTNRYLLL